MMRANLFFGRMKHNSLLIGLSMIMLFRLGGSVYGQSGNTLDKNQDIEMDVNLIDGKISSSNPKSINFNYQTNEDVLGTITTKYSEDNENRAYNIKLGSKKLNNQVILPGHELSVNKVIGPRTKNNGFKLAHEFSNGKTISGYGGGVCQVSSTLFNAVLLANLKIVQRNHHSMPIWYLPVGLDAAIYNNSKDFIFVNNTNTPIKIISECNSGNLTFTILGKKEPGITVKVSSKNLGLHYPNIEYIIDSKLKIGSKQVRQSGGKAGRAIAYRKVYKNGMLIATDTFQSNYTGGTRIIAINPKSKE